MQKLSVVLVFCVVALSLVSAEEAKYKRLVPVNPEPLCSLLEVVACAAEIGGKTRVETKNSFSVFAKMRIFVKLHEILIKIFFYFANFCDDTKTFAKLLDIHVSKNVSQVLHETYLSKTNHSCNAKSSF
jgi:hypothetical protein